MDWLITLPKKVSWNTYKRELDAVEDRKGVLCFPVSHLPKEMEIGDRMFLLWNGKIKGWMEIVYFGWMRRFRCRTTEKHLPEGYYIQRSGEFHEIKGVKMTGFRGIRKYPKIDDVYDQLKEVYKINREIKEGENNVRI